MTLTEIRKAMAAPLGMLPGRVKVAVGEAKEGEPHDQMIVGITLGPPTPEHEALLDEMLEAAGERSVKALLEADRTLGGSVEDLMVVANSGYRLYPSPEGPQLGAEWTVTYVT